MPRGSGIFETDRGFRVFVRVNKKLLSKTFPRGTSREDMRRWRELQRVSDFYQLASAPVHGGTFSDDVTRYLELVSSMRSIADRTYQMRQWGKVFGLLPRSAITSLMIQAQLEKWRKKGSISGGALSASSLNHRRVALSHFFTTMHGKGGLNPVRDVPGYPEEELPLDLPTFSDAEKVIEQVRTVTRGAKSQARLRLMLYTGWPAATIMRIRKEDIHAKSKTVTLHGRRKGKGTKPVTLPVSAQGWAAIQQFIKWQAFGEFSSSGLYKTLHHACDECGVKRFRPYDLRHLFLTKIVQASKDERGAKELGMTQQIHRYTRHAASQRARSALNAAFG